MTQPLLHPRTKQALDLYLKTPSHALILRGPTGIGKLHVALWTSHKQNTESFIIKPEDDKTTISIDQIRSLYTLTKTGSPLTVIIEDAHTMGEAAQNAFLKLLEEPPKNTWFILTYGDSKQVLPTISSRSQQITILPPPPDVLLQHAKTLNSAPEQTLRSILHTTRALPGRFFEVIHDQKSLEEHANIVNEAKEFYSANSYQRHLICIKHGFEKNWVKNLLDTLAVILESLISSSSSDQAKLKKLTKQALLVEETAENVLQINGNPKIHLVKLCEEL